MNDDEVEIRRRIATSPTFRRWFVDQALLDPPPDWASRKALTPTFRRWFVEQLEREIAMDLVDRDPSDEAAADDLVVRADILARLQWQWGVVHPDVQRQTNQVLAAIIDKARTGDAHRPVLDPTLDPRRADPDAALGWVLWLATVECQTCGTTLAKVTSGDDDLILDHGVPSYFDPKSLLYVPEPVRESGHLIWRCRRCRADRGLAESRAFKVVRGRWLSRNKTLVSAAPMGHATLIASPVATTAE